MQWSFYSFSEKSFGCVKLSLAGCAVQMKHWTICIPYILAFARCYQHISTAHRSFYWLVDGFLNHWWYCCLQEQLLSMLSSVGFALQNEGRSWHQHYTLCIHCINKVLLTCKCYKQVIVSYDWWLFHAIFLNVPVSWVIMLVCCAWCLGCYILLLHAVLICVPHRYLQTKEVANQ